MRTAALVVLGLSLTAHSSPAAAAEPKDKAPVAEGDPLPGAKEFKQCQKLPPGKRILKLNLKPDSEITDLIGWMSAISCTNFAFSGPVLRGRKVTVMAPALLTPEEAYQLFIGALQAVDLRAEPVSKANGGGAVIKIVPRDAPPGR